MKYLGINLTKSVQNLHEENYKTLLLQAHYKAAGLFGKNKAGKNRRQENSKYAMN